MNIKTVAVIGAGTMGQGIAQLALQANHQVILVDQSLEQLSKAKSALEKLFNRFIDKSKITTEQASSWLNNLQLQTEMQQISEANLVIEAIVERLDVKKSLFSTIEDIVSDDTILATNTSSLSVTQIASALKLPHRFLGLHFFNPAGIMPLVEVVKAVQSDNGMVDVAKKLMQTWGKTPVVCRDTPSFIVNRVARPFYVESFRLLEEGAIDHKDLDASLKDGMKFRMGPCELTDFIGHDINYSVSVSLWQELGYPKHLQPSFVQKDLVSANYLGRKNGRGFYQYQDKSLKADSPQASNSETTVEQVATITFSESKASEINELINASDYSSSYASKYIGTLENGVVVLETNGQRASSIESQCNVPIAVIDICPTGSASVRAIAYSPQAKKIMGNNLPDISNTTQGELTKKWALMPDRPGLVNLRVISLIINEACHAVLHDVTDEAGVDSALKGGVNYPKGAFKWLAELGITPVFDVLTELGYHYGTGHYVVSPYLRDKFENFTNS